MEYKHGWSDHEKWQIIPSPYINHVFEPINSENRSKDKVKQLGDKISRLYLEYKQPPQEVFIRKKAYELLKNTTFKYFRNSYLALGGSLSNNLNVHGADMDLCFSLKCTGTKDVYDEGIAACSLMRLRYVLEELPEIDNILFIRARVPILKVKMAFPYHPLEVDINCNCVAGIYNSHLLHYFSKFDDRFQILAIVLKKWAKTNYVVDPRYGKLNSYTIILMLIHFLQCGVNPPILPNFYSLFPQYFSGTIDVEKLDYDLILDLPKLNKNDRSIEELMFGFLNYYTIFEYHKYGISIKNACVFNRSFRPRDESGFLFFLEEAYDEMTVPKNLTEYEKLQDILDSFRNGRNGLFADMGFDLKNLDYSNDYSF